MLNEIIVLLLHILCNYLLLLSDGIVNDSFTIVGVIGKIKLSDRYRTKNCVQ